MVDQIELVNWRLNHRQDGRLSFILLVSLGRFIELQVFKFVSCDHSLGN